MGFQSAVPDPAVEDERSGADRVLITIWPIEHGAGRDEAQLGAEVTSEARPWLSHGHHHGQRVADGYILNRRQGLSGERRPPLRVEVGLDDVCIEGRAVMKRDVR